MCETNPGYCGVSNNRSLHDIEYTRIGDVELSIICFIVLLPILLAFLMPIMNARFNVCGDRVVRGTILDWRTEDPHQETNKIDPPLILWLLPKDCGATGLLTVVSIMVSIFVVTFFLMLLNSWPCSTGLYRRKIRYRTPRRKPPDAAPTSHLQSRGAEGGVARSRASVETSIPKGTCSCSAASPSLRSYSYSAFLRCRIASASSIMR